MKGADLYIYARVLHVLGVIFWIGGVAFVTTILIPSIRRIPDAEKRWELFERIEIRFSRQAKISTLITGFSGLYMLAHLDAWDRYLNPQLWWMHLMTLVWLIFTVVLFILEPWFLHRWFQERALRDSESAFRMLHAMHLILLTLSIIAVFGAVAGVRGFVFG